MTALTLALVNQRTDEALAERVEVAVTRRDRRKGLLGRTGFEPSSALIIAPCFSIHTMFMRFDIDAVFVDDDGRAVKVVRDMTPWRVAVDPTAHAVVELPAGSLRDRAGQRRRSPVSARTGRQARRVVGATTCGGRCAEPRSAARRGARARAAIRGGAAQRGAAQSVHAPAGHASGQPRILGAGRAHALSAAEAADGGCCRLLLVLGAGSFLYFMAPQPAMASMFAWKELPEAPTLDTGASFSVTIAVARQQRRRRLRGRSRPRRSDSRRSRESRRAAASCIRRWSAPMRRSTRPRECSAG